MIGDAADIIDVDVDDDVCVATSVALSHASAASIAANRVLERVRLGDGRPLVAPSTGLSTVARSVRALGFLIGAGRRFFASLSLSRATDAR